MNILGIYYIYYGYINNVLDVKVYFINLLWSNYF